MKSISSVRQPDFKLEKYPCGGYILWLRENYHNSETEDGSLWTYDEYTILMPEHFSDSFIALHFDEFIAEARQKEANDAEKRMTAVEDAVADLADIIGGLLDG